MIVMMMMMMTMMMIRWSWSWHGDSHGDGDVMEAWSHCWDDGDDDDDDYDDDDEHGCDHATRFPYQDVGDVDSYQHPLQKKNHHVMM